MLVIPHISLKDMSYKLYVTYTCCVILDNIQIHFKPSRTYIYIQQSIVFGHLLLRMHYLMAPPGLDPEEGSQRFTSFLVELLLFASRAVTYKPAGCVSLVRNVYTVNVCVCAYSPTSIGSLSLFSFCFQLCRVSGCEQIVRCPSASEPRTGSHKSAVY